jgi:hypothetical protein
VDAPPCGDVGEACCANRTCNSDDLTCTGRRNPTCEVASTDGGDQID